MVAVKLRPFFSIYGGKWRVSKYYPKPKFQTLIEPFAGGGGYSLNFPHLNVVLYERDERIAGIWRYLIEEASPEEILSIPDIAPDGSIDDLRGYPKEVKWLVGFWLNRGVVAPCNIPSKWMRSGIRPGCFWGSRVKETIATQLPAIRHWEIHNKGFEQCQFSGEATWFIDPPYKNAGVHYRYGSKMMDYAHLADWCRTRRGQVMVCENEGAGWLDFKPLAQTKTQHTKNNRRSREVLWENE